MAFCVATHNLTIYLDPFFVDFCQVFLELVRLQGVLKGMVDTRAPAYLQGYHIGNDSNHGHLYKGYKANNWTVRYDYEDGLSGARSEARSRRLLVIELCSERSWLRSSCSSLPHLSEDNN